MILLQQSNIMLYLKAYEAYTQAKYDRCLAFIKESKETDEKVQDLLAQVYFQMRDYQKAYDIYQTLEATPARKENIQTLIVCAQLEKPGSLKCNETNIPTAEDIIDQVQVLNINDPTVYDLFPKPPKRIKNQIKKRKIRLPKRYDPNNGPDPERWIARRDRKNQKGKKKRSKYHKK